MPEIGDVVETVIVTELDGVAMSTKLFWRIEDIGAGDSVFDNISKIGIAFATAVENFTSAEWSVTCITYTNRSRIEAKVVAPLMGFGAEIDDSHPQNQVLQIRRFGLYAVDNKVRNGHIFLSGVTEPHSTRGRFNEMAKLADIEDFLGEVQVLLAGGWTIFPMLEITPDWVLFPMVKVFIQVDQAQANPVFSVLTGRRTKLCGTA